MLTQPRWAASSCYVLFKTEDASLTHLQHSALCKTQQWRLLEPPKPSARVMVRNKQWRNHRKDIFSSITLRTHSRIIFVRQQNILWNATLFTFFFFFFCKTLCTENVTSHRINLTEMKILFSYALLCSRKGFKFSNLCLLNIPGCRNGY